MENIENGNIKIAKDIFDPIKLQAMISGEFEDRKIYHRFFDIETNTILTLV